MTSPLDSGCQLALMSGAGAGHTARKDLGAVGNKFAKPRHILVVNRLNLIHAEGANLPTALAAAAAVIAIICLSLIHI